MKKPSVRKKKPSTLVVDDNAQWRQIVRSIVETILGISPLVASSGGEAIDLLKSRRIHVVVCDLNMPKMSGIQFLEQARRISPKTKIIMMSGDLDDPGLAHELTSRGAFAVTSKAEILSSLANLFARLEESD